jgi:proteic killer suppression protein
LLIHSESWAAEHDQVLQASWAGAVLYDRVEGRDTTNRLALQLGFLSSATNPGKMDVPGWDLHPLKGVLAGRWSVKVNGNWRLTFQFIGTDVEVVDYEDYH